jgi:pimeloyl-ACP methyl ester carboxylesterase
MKKLQFFLLIVTLLTLWQPSPLLAQSGAVNMERITFPVTLSDGQPYNLVGYLYTGIGNPDNVVNCGQRNHTLQVLVHGGSYNHTYWDAGVINGNDYSYARSMARQCYSVLAIDRLGTGESSKPDGDFINLANEADALSQILAGLRTNHNPTQRRFKRIVLVGHSFGSFLSVYTLGEYGNLADAAVITGWIHSPAEVPIDPALFEALRQTPYIISPPEVRTALFYRPIPTDPALINTTDPAVIAYDNANFADAMTRGFFDNAIAMFTARHPVVGSVAQIKALSKVDQVNVPVFVQLGDNDFLFPAAVAGPEASFYSNAPAVVIDVLSNMGHAFNLHTNHSEGWQRINNWIQATVVD